MENLIYLYDGTLEGCLSAVFTAYAERTHPHFIRQETGFQLDMLMRTQHIDTNAEQADRVRKGLIEKAGEEAWLDLCTAFLSADDNRATVIYQMVRRFMRFGAQAQLDRADPWVNAFCGLCRQVGFEYQRLQGFVRFRAIQRDGDPLSLSEGGDSDETVARHLEGREITPGARVWYDGQHGANVLYYAHFAPDNDLLERLAGFFAERLNDQQWMLHDVKRHKAALYQNGQWLVIHDVSLTPPPLGAEERYYRALWRGFFQSLTIDARRNLRAQQQHLPKKYWRHMSEMYGVS